MKIVFYVEGASAGMMMNCLEVTAVHSTRDMSVANRTEVTGFYPYRTIGMLLDKDVSLMAGCPPCQVVAVSERETSLSWMGKTYTVAVGETVETQEYAIENPYLSWDGISMNIKYMSLDVWDNIFSLFDHIALRHEKNPFSVKHTDEEKEKCLKLLHEVIHGGEKGLLPIYAWLSSSEDWNTMIISDSSRFREALGDIPLVYDDTSGVWISNFAQIITRNELAQILDGVPDIKRFLELAADGKNEKAREILSGGISFQRLT